MMEIKEKNFVSAVIYVYNAADRIEIFLKTVMEVLEENFEHSEIICVNDGSNDNSLQIIKKISEIAVCTNISVLNMSCFHGLELAMNAGLDLAIGDFVFEFDNTFLNYDKSEIMNIYRRSLQGCDIVSAVPDGKEKFTSKLFYKVFARFADLPYELHTESFRILSRRVINRVGAMNKTVPYRKAVYAASGLKTDMVIYKRISADIPKGDRREKDYRSGLAINSLILFTEVGYKFSIAMTTVMMLMSVFMLLYSVFIYAISRPVAGWTTTILFLSVAFFGLFGILTIIIKYLQLLLDLVFRKKRYCFESIEKLTR